jgi:hypothetical protein
MRRISIRTLMAFILVSAVGLAALRNANELWAGMMLLLALASVGVAILGAALMKGRERAWWLGFAVFGGGYLVAALCPVRSDLATTRLLHYVIAQSSLQPVIVARTPARNFRMIDGRYDKAALDSFARDSGPGIPLIDVKDDKVIVLQEPPTRWRGILPGTANRDAFVHAGHSVFSLLAGLVGGTLAMWFWRRRERGLRPCDSPG